MHNKSVISALLCSTVLLTGVHAVQAQPVTCKGLEQATCMEAANCRWVDSYKRSDGREINGYCRKLPSRSVKDLSGIPEPRETQPKKS